MNGMSPFIKKAGSSGGFGDGSDGDGYINSAVQWETTTGVPHTGFIVKQYKNLTIDTSGVVTPARYMKGMFIFCRGNLTINGTIDISKLGSTSTDTGSFARINLRMLPQPNLAKYKAGKLLDTDAYSAPLLGALGGPRGSGGGDNGRPGIAGINGQLGGGGGGRDAGQGGVGGAGGQAQAFGGGGGGSTGMYCGTGYHLPGNDGIGCAGGITPSVGGCAQGWGSSGGAGIPAYGLAGGGYGGNVGPSEEGVGGHLWIFVKGTLTLGQNCRILANGARGGQAAFGGGGGSGGGSINIFYMRNLVTVSGYTIDTSGGLSGITTIFDGHGGAGSLRGPMRIKRWA